MKRSSVVPDFPAWEPGNEVGILHLVTGWKEMPSARVKLLGLDFVWYILLRRQQGIWVLTLSRILG